MHFAVCEIKNNSSFSSLAIQLILKFIANIDQLVIQLRYHFLIVNCRLEMIRSISRFSNIKTSCPLKAGHIEKFIVTDNIVHIHFIDEAHYKRLV